MKKILWLILTLSILALTSCEGLKDLDLGGIIGGNGGTGDNGGGDTGQGDGGSDVGDESLPIIWDETSQLYVITPDGVSWRDSFYDSFAYTAGFYPTAHSDTKEKMPHEIVIGPSTRAISKTAYRILERNMTEDDDATGYLFYAEGGSLAIAYSNDSARIAALAFFSSEYVGDELRLDDGVVYYDFYSLSVRANENREAKREEHFKKIEAEHGKELADALRTLYTIYNEEIYIWMANLYDPETGGYYRSNTGRDNFGFLPDLESTYFVYKSLGICGMFDDVGGAAGAIPEDMQATVIKWVQGLQSSEDGYFYHPQWGKAITTSRRGRDLDWAEMILSQFGAVPYYNTPSGKRGTYGAPGPNATIPTVSRLGTSAIKAVAAIVPLASNLPEYLQSLEAWEARLDSLNVTGNPYGAGNNIVSDHALIKRAGKAYIDFTINYLNERQDPELGIWGKVENDTDYDPTDGLDYETVNGLMKIAGVYSYLGKPMPNIEQALDSAIRIALYENTDEDEHACCTFNPWTTMQMLIAFEKQVNGKESSERLRAQILEQAPLLVQRTFEKAVTHIREGGGFSYYETHVSNNSQGALVACSTVPEADLNSETLFTASTLDAMFHVFNIDIVPLWYIDDYYVYMNILTNLGNTIKQEFPEVETVTFNDYSENEVENGSELVPHDLVNVRIYDHRYLSSTVVNKPDRTSNSDLALRVETKTAFDDTGKKLCAKSVTNTYVQISNKYASGDCYVFETDMRVESSDKDVFAQIFLAGDLSGKETVGFTFRLVDGKNGPEIRIYDLYYGPDGKRNTNIYTGLALNEWFNIKLETYKIYEENDDGEKGALLDVLTKLYINGQYIYTSNAANRTADKTKLRNYTIDRAYIGHYRETSSVIYLDNIRAEKLDKEYVKEYDPTEPNLPDIDIEPGVDHNYVAGFEQGRTNDAYMWSYAVTPTGTFNIMKNDFDAEKYKDTIIHYSLATDVGGRVSTALRVATVQQNKYNLSYSYVNVSNTEPAGNTATFEMKYYLESAASGSVTQLHFLGTNSKELVGVSMYYDANAGHIYLKQVNNYNSSSEGYQDGYHPGTGNAVIPGTYLPKARWFTLRFVFFATGDPDTSRLKIYADVEDGETMKCIADIIAYFNVNEVSNIKRVQIAHQRTNTAVVYLDDVSLTRTDLAYEEEEVAPTTPAMVAPPPDPILPEITMPDTIDGTTSGVVTDFANGAILDDYLSVVVGGKKGSNEAPDAVEAGETFGGSSYTYYELKGDVQDKIDDLVLHIKTDPANYSNYQNSEVRIKTSNENPDGYVYTFQMDVMYTYKTQDALANQFFFGSTQAPSIGVKTTKNGVMLRYNGKNIDGVIIPYDEWASLRFVLVAPVGNNNSDNYVLHIYVKSSTTGGEFKKQHTITGFTNGTYKGMNKAFDTFCIYNYGEGGVSEYYLDNMSFTRTVEP